jgi:hypothetical protein
MYRDRVSTEAPGVSEEGLEALEKLGNKHRIRILQVLIEAETPLPFAELRRKVGIEDTGKFNYHLTELTELFVSRTDGGYELSQSGERVVVAASDIDADPTAIDSETRWAEECPICGETDCGKLVHIHLSGK